MGMFVALVVDQIRCRERRDCHRCMEVCPVEVFRVMEGRLITDPENEDECTLCELCLQTCPQGAIRLVRLYEPR